MFLHAIHLLAFAASVRGQLVFGDHTNHTTLPHHPENILPTNINHLDRPYRSASRLSKNLRPLQPRDSITIDISNTFNNSDVTNAQNNVKFQVINNAKNAAIAMGDNATHNVTLDSFGDKNMINSTGSATGGWNTKNHGTNISTESHKREACEDGCGKEGVEVNEESGLQPRAALDLVNLSIMNGKVKGSHLTESGNGNSVELHIAGNGDNVVNVTIAWEAEDSDFEDSVNNNTVKIYLGDMKGDMGNNTIVIT